MPHSSSKPVKKAQAWSSNFAVAPVPDGPDALPKVNSVTPTLASWPVHKSPESAAVNSPRPLMDSYKRNFSSAFTEGCSVAAKDAPSSSKTPKASKNPARSRGQLSTKAVCRRHYEKPEDPHFTFIQKDRVQKGQQTLGNPTISFQDGWDTLMADWTPLEVQAGRRLVFLTVDRKGTSFRLSFQVLPFKDFNSDGRQFVVSCFRPPVASSYRDQRADQKAPYYITSSDLLYLMQGILATSFTDKVKDAVRRAWHKRCYVGCCRCQCTGLSD